MIIPSAGRVLALDWGSSRIGLAFSDESQLIATPHGTIRRRASKRLPLGEFLTLVTSETPVGLLVGLALDDEGREGDSAYAAREMGNLFSARSGLPVEWSDESFTTVTAGERLTAAGYRRIPQDLIDAAAAATMLQSWLDRRREAATR